MKNDSVGKKKSVKDPYDATVKRQNKYLRRKIKYTPFKDIKNKPEMIFITIIASLLVAIGIGYVLNPFGLYASGLTGLIQLISQASDKYFGVTLNLGFLILIANIPLFIIAMKKLSPKFAIFSTFSVLIQSIILFFPPVVSFDLDILAAAVFGGILAGAGIGLIMKYGASTGGFDIVAMYLSIEKGVSITRILFVFNMVLLILAALIADINIAIYSALRLMMTTFVLDKVHTSYKHVQVLISLPHAEQHAKEIAEKMNRGATVLDGFGAYTNHKRKIIFMVISAYEATKLRNIVIKLEPTAFITVSNTSLMEGRFLNRVIR